MLMQFRRTYEAEDKSLFKADGPVWHKSDRRARRIPQKLRRLDTEATWSKSGYQTWVYGYGNHITCTEAAFPKMVQVETAAVADSEVLDQKAAFILIQLRPASLTADDRYTKALRIRHWIRQGTLLITSALRWVKGRYAQAYHRFLAEADIQERFKKRKTSLEPLFDLYRRVAMRHCQSHWGNRSAKAVTDAKTCKCTNSLGLRHPDCTDFDDDEPGYR
jgi:hypothetical protein